MSRTRELMADLRRRLGADDPLPLPVPLPKVPPPPVRVFPTPRRRSRLADEAAAHTTALVGIGHVGTRYATDVVLQFQAELAVAHHAVAAELPEDWPARQGMLLLRTRVDDHREFLLRPDLGRRLREESLAELTQQATRDVDVQIILADGLSAVACMGSGVELASALTAECQARGWTVGLPVCAKFARVWLQDEIGEAVGAKVAVIVLGERPGLGTGDGLSAYLVYEPRMGKTDGDRNMMSNIHERGTPPAQAARRLAVLIGAMLDQQRSGVELDLSQLGTELGEAAGTGYRAPQVRERLVETER
ncbi:MAG: ethanolamine ammonia-lyase subunit EutC [Deltaproteobacteria bacterium]|jgi:ethanolamine ammonia-lyase small subunit|nr:ethanolamine ammonia-lyase subunit EutC [Deltaproteobacteria bacterium]MBW2531900.1 ethanolamine ammonia-lyase subunit EutC [Deltaproteobacteria bacterium]